MRLGRYTHSQASTELVHTRIRLGKGKAKATSFTGAVHWVMNTIVHVSFPIKYSLSLYASGLPKYSVVNVACSGWVRSIDVYTSLKCQGSIKY